MTIGAWIAFGFVAAIIIVASIATVYTVDSNGAKILAVILSIALIIGILFGMLAYFRNSAAGQRALVDQKSNFGNGLDRTITVYTADGGVIAQYSGKIDIEANDGGYIKFDFEGNRYIYYNCFVESVADIEED